MRAIRALKSLKEHLPKGDVEEKFVNEYHSILTVAENQIGRALDEHNIPASEIKRRLVAQRFDDYGELIDASYSDVRFCDRNFFTFKIDDAIAHLSSFNSEEQVAEQSQFMPPINAAQNTLNVFVVHGRNLEARNSLFRFLRSIGLRPLEWSQAITETGKASPFIGEILDVAFSKAQAVVVLLTPDDEARLSEPFRNPHDLPYESQLTGQARPNVLFEAGMAMGRNPDRTIIVELGTLRPFSDIAGRHTIRLSNDSAARQELAQRLQTAGCAVDLTGRDWHTEGNFDIPSLNAAKSARRLPSKGTQKKQGTSASTLLGKPKKKRLNIVSTALATTEFEEIKANILLATLANGIASEVKRLKTFIHGHSFLLERNDINDFYKAWIIPHEIELEYGGSLNLTQAQYDQMKEQLAQINLKN